MKKQFIALTVLLAVVVALFLGVPVVAATPRSTVVPTLSFSGTTAECSVRVVNNQADIEVVLELWENENLIDSWAASGRSYVSIDETCRVVRGRTYTLKAYGTFNGVSFSETTVTKTYQ